MNLHTRALVLLHCVKQALIMTSARDLLEKTTCGYGRWVLINRISSTGQPKGSGSADNVGAKNFHIKRTRTYDIFF
jgi:hypothetical protein